jgi:hypothetical protein
LGCFVVTLLPRNDEIKDRLPRNASNDGREAYLNCAAALRVLQWRFYKIMISIPPLREIYHVNNNFVIAVFNTHKKYQNIFIDINFLEQSESIRF